MREAGPTDARAVWLDDHLDVWRHLIHMVSGEPAVIRRLAAPRLCPPLESEPEEHAVALPDCIAWFEAPELNRGAYRLLSLQLAGRRELGTYRSGVVARMRRASGRASALEELFTLVESSRVQHRIGRAYPGSASGARRLAAAWLARAPASANLAEVRTGISAGPPLADAHDRCDASGDGRARLFVHTRVVLPERLAPLRPPSSSAMTGPVAAATGEYTTTTARPADPDLGEVCDTLFALSLAKSIDAGLPPWLPAATAARVLAHLATVARDAATPATSLEVARRLLGLLATPVLQRMAAGAAGPVEHRSVPAFEAVDVFDLSCGDSAEEDRTEARLELGPDAGDEASETPGQQASAAASGNAEVGDAPCGGASETGTPAVPVRLRPSRTGAAQTFTYDEWDHTIGGYRKRRCRVYELPVPVDSGAFFEQTLRRSRPLLTEVRRQFERVRPERYRPLRGLEDGEDFDLNALTEARIDARSRRSPSSRIYTRRARQTRDIATLFLVDQSASTDQPHVEPGDPPARKIIETIKEALAVMSTALQELGDSYAILGFSSQGPRRVELFPIKEFREPLNAAVRARIGGMTPRFGTRMGAAVRHAATKLARAHASRRHLILLSDGFPQDHEYGSDRHSHDYGLADTAVALREIRAAGVTPFCITVDRTGSDYLRRMCEPWEYLVIGDVEALPRELPKIYRRVVRG